MTVLYEIDTPRILKLYVEFVEDYDAVIPIDMQNSYIEHMKKHEKNEFREIEKRLEDRAGVVVFHNGEMVLFHKGF